MINGKVPVHHHRYLAKPVIPLVTAGPNLANLLRTVEYDEGIYEGQTGDCENREGKGIYLADDFKFVCIGSWKKNQLHGNAFIIFGNKGLVYGNFHSNKLHGYGLVHLENNEIVIGNWDSNRLEGRAYLFNPTRKCWICAHYSAGVLIRYEAEERVFDTFIKVNQIPSFMKNDACALGLLNSLQRSDIFSKINEELNHDGKKIGYLKITECESFLGVHQNGVPEGLGVIVSKGSNIICGGNFKSGLINGFGKLTLDNGDSYDGFFKNGVFHLRGYYFNKAGNDYFFGDFAENVCTKILSNGQGFPIILINQFKREIHQKSLYYNPQGTLKIGDFGFKNDQLQALVADDSNADIEIKLQNTFTTFTDKESSIEQLSNREKSLFESDVLFNQEEQITFSNNEFGNVINNKPVFTLDITEPESSRSSYRGGYNLNTLSQMEDTFHHIPKKLSPKMSHRVRCLSERNRIPDTPNREETQQLKKKEASANVDQKEQGIYLLSRKMDQFALPTDLLPSQKTSSNVLTPILQKKASPHPPMLPDPSVINVQPFQIVNSSEPRPMRAYSSDNRKCLSELKSMGKDTDSPPETSKFPAELTFEDCASGRFENYKRQSEILGLKDSSKLNESLGLKYSSNVGVFSNMSFQSMKESDEFNSKRGADFAQEIATSSIKMEDKGFSKLKRRCIPSLAGENSGKGMFTKAPVRNSKDIKEMIINRKSFSLKENNILNKIAVPSLHNKFNNSNNGVVVSRREIEVDAFKDASNIIVPSVETERILKNIPYHISTQF